MDDSRWTGRNPSKSRTDLTLVVLVHLEKNACN